MGGKGKGGTFAIELGKNLQSFKYQWDYVMNFSSVGVWYRNSNVERATTVLYYLPLITLTK